MEHRTRTRKLRLALLFRPICEQKPITSLIHSTDRYRCVAGSILCILSLQSISTVFCHHRDRLSGLFADHPSCPQHTGESNRDRVKLINDIPNIRHRSQGRQQSVSRVVLCPRCALENASVKWPHVLRTILVQMANFVVLRSDACDARWCYRCTEELNRMHGTFATVFANDVESGEPPSGSEKIISYSERCAD